MTAPASRFSPQEEALAKRLLDYEFWAGKLYYIRDKEDKLVLLRLNDAQRIVLEAERRMMRETGRVRLYVLKGRQGGVTTSEQAQNLHVAWKYEGANCMTLAHERDATDKVFEITRRAVQNFDAALLWDQGDRERREVSFPGNDSHFYTNTAGAQRVGRGLTLLRLHGSEFAFWEEPRVILGAVEPTLERPRTSITLETTASSFDSEAHKFWKDARRGKNGYRAVFIPWWVCDREHYRMPLEDDKEITRATLEKGERVLVDEFGLSFEQIKWRRDRIAAMGLDMFLREYAEDDETCWLVAGRPVYDVFMLKALLARAPQAVETYYQATLEVFVMGTRDGQVRPVVPPGEKDVIIGADVAEGVGGDRSTWIARSFPSWRLLAKFADAHVEPDKFAAVLNEWGRLYTNEKGQPAYLVIEKNAHGITVLRKLRDTHKYPLARIFHRTSQDEQYDKQSGRIGWLTNAETQPLMVDAGRDLFRAAYERTVEPPSADAVRDGFAVQRDDKGKAPLTGRDVLVAEVLAWLGRDSLPRIGGVVRW